MESASGSQSVSQPHYSAMRQSYNGYELKIHGSNGELGVQNPDLVFDDTQKKTFRRLSSRSSSRHEVENGNLGLQKPVSSSKQSREKGFSREKDEPLSQIGELMSGNADSGLTEMRKKSRLKMSRRSGKFEDELSSRASASAFSPSRRNHSKSPYKPRKEDTMFQNVSSFSKNEDRRYLSPHKLIGEGPDLVTDGAISSKRIENHRVHMVKDKRDGYEKSYETSRVSGISNYSHRSQSAPRPRYAQTEENEPTTVSPLPWIKTREANRRHTSSFGDYNEMAARAPRIGVIFENTDSDSLGDIFFSKEYTAMKMALQNNVLPDKETEQDHMLHQLDKGNGGLVDNDRRNSSIAVTTQTSMASNSSFNRQNIDRVSASTKTKLSVTSGSTTRLMDNRRKGQGELCCSWLRTLICWTKSQDKVEEFDEATFIEKAFVDETLRKFWADKHQPTLLDEFTCQKQAAQSLKQLVRHATCPHILLKGPRGSGKKALTIALLCEIFGKSAQDISHELRYFHVKGNKPTQVVIPMTSSAHHVELNVQKEPNINYALLSLVKEISSNFATAPEVSLAIGRTDYKVIILYDVDKATETILHLIKWIMDCYTESCKLILCCEDDERIPEPVTNRCKVVKINAPMTREIMKVLIQVAEEEKFDLPKSFAAKIAKRSRHNLRQAIMALEACKSQNYPFADDQPIPLGWEEVVKDLAEEILTDSSDTRLYYVRSRLQKLLVEFVHPKLILQGLVEQFLKAVEDRSKRELYFWHSYYEKRLPIGTTALLKLEEFVAKFMRLHRRQISMDRTISGSTG